MNKAVEQTEGVWGPGGSKPAVRQGSDGVFFLSLLFATLIPVHFRATADFSCWLRLGCYCYSYSDSVALEWIVTADLCRCEVVCVDEC